MSQNKDIGPLIKNKLFDGVNSKTLKLNLRQNNFLTFREGDIIFKTGDSSENIFLIIDGEVKLKILNPSGSATIYRKGKNDFFGEIELYEKISRKSSAVANIDCVIYSLSRKELYELLSTNKILRENIYPDLNEEPDMRVNEVEEKKDFQIYEHEESIENQEHTEQQEISTEIINDDKDVFIESEVEKEIKNVEENINFHLDESENLIENEEDILIDESPIDLTEQLDENNIFSSALEGEFNINEDLIPKEISSYEEEIKEDNFSIDREIENLGNIPPAEEKTEGVDLQKILQIVRKIYEHHDLEKTIRSITGALIELFDVQIVRIFLIDKNKNELWSFPFMENNGEIKRIKFGDGLIGNSAITGDIINLVNPAADIRFNKQIDSIEYIDEEDILLFPVKNNDGQIICIIQMINSGKGGFIKDDEEILFQVSNDISTAIENLSEYGNDLKFSEPVEEIPESENTATRLSYSDELIHWNMATEFIVSDLKTTLSLIKRYSEFIKKKTEIKEIKQVTDFIKEQANTAIKYSEIVSNYINGKSSLHKEVLDLNSVLDELLETLAEFVESRNAKLFKKYETDAFVKVDRTAFYFVCFQITKNACEAMPAGGNIYIITKKTDNSVIIEFRDTGKGIDEEIKDKIFEPYASFGKEGNAGLGLAIASKIIKEHDGELKIGPLSMEGASMIIELPIIDME